MVNSTIPESDIENSVSRECITSFVWGGPALYTEIPNSEILYSLCITPPNSL